MERFNFRAFFRKTKIQRIQIQYITETTKKLIEELKILKIISFIYILYPDKKNDVLNSLNKTHVKCKSTQRYVVLPVKMRLNAKKLLSFKLIKNAFKKSRVDIFLT